MSTMLEFTPFRSERDRLGTLISTKNMQKKKKITHYKMTGSQRTQNNFFLNGPDISNINK
jgi:hypothetical protein